MDRRTFLRRLGFGTVAAAAAASTFDLERLLWVPGEKAIVVPPAPTIATLGETFRIGDVFTIEGMFARNPVTGRPTSVLKRFTITACDAPSITTSRLIS